MKVTQNNKIKCLLIKAQPMKDTMKNDGFHIKVSNHKLLSKMLKL